MTSTPSNRIVLIDDEPGVLKALTLLLQAMGCQVMAFAAPQEALTYLKAGIDADLILSDQRMPGMTGSELFSMLRASAVRTPFILMSGHADQSDMGQLLESPNTAFLSKPFTPTSLQAAINNVLSSNKAANAD